MHYQVWFHNPCPLNYTIDPKDDFLAMNELATVNL